MFLGISILGLLDTIEKYAHKDLSWKKELKTALIKILSMLVIVIVLILV